MGLEPEAVGVLRDLDAQVGAVEVGAEVLLDAVGDGLALEGVVEGLAHRELAHVLGVEVLAGVVVQLALAGHAVERRRFEGEGENSVDHVLGKALTQEPVLVGCRRELRGFDAVQQRVDDCLLCNGHVALLPWFRRQEQTGGRSAMAWAGALHVAFAPDPADAESPLAF